MTGPERTSTFRTPPLPFMQRRAGFTALLGSVFVTNYIETTVEVALHRRFGLGSELGARIADAFSTLEGHISFESHDMSNWLAVYGYSISISFSCRCWASRWQWRSGGGATCTATGCSASRSRRTICSASCSSFQDPSVGRIPTQERCSWSDRWSSTLIDLLRPISALDNCFPSTHVSFTVIVVPPRTSTSRLRHTMTILGITVVVSTFVLGIHWIPRHRGGPRRGRAQCRRRTPADTAQQRGDPRGHADGGIILLTRTNS